MGKSMVFAPQTEGEVSIRASQVQFAEALRRRVAARLLTGQPHPRSKYALVQSAPGELRIQAADWRTAINVGLNDLHMRLERPGLVHFSVRYWRWAAYALGVSGALALVGLGLLLTLDVRGYIARHPSSMIPGLSLDQHVLFAWAMVIFWGLAWPWLLIALHKRPLRRLIQRIIAEVDAAAVA